MLDNRRPDYNRQNQVQVHCSAQDDSSQPAVSAVSFRIGNVCSSLGRTSKIVQVFNISTYDIG